VNSLVYPRLFEEAALARIDALGVGGSWLCRKLEVAFKRPCFAGERARVSMRLARVGDRLFAHGFLAGEGDRDPASRPRAVVRMVLEADA
jgi:acyl-CoA thioesterase FadM